MGGRVIRGLNSRSSYIIEKIKVIEVNLLQSDGVRKKKEVLNLQKVSLLHLCSAYLLAEKNRR